MTLVCDLSCTEPLTSSCVRWLQECLKKCLQLVKQGVPVLFFPEGTRTTDGAMAAFKVWN